MSQPQGGLQFDLTVPPGQGEWRVLEPRWLRDATAFAPKLKGGFAGFPTGSVALALEGAGAAGEATLTLEVTD